MLDTLDQIAVEEPGYVFTGLDRCDATTGVRGHGGAIVVPEQAYHRWTKGDAEVLLCNHHNNAHCAKLFMTGWNVEHSPLADHLADPLDINSIEPE